MIKLMIIGRRAPGISRSAAHRHLRDVHGQMVVCPPAGARAMPSDYVQNHVFDGAYPAGTGAHTIERDLVTELWFESIDDLRASTGTPYYLENLKPDEPRFVDDSTVEKLMVQPHALAERGAGQFKFFWLVSGAIDNASFEQKLLNQHGLECAVRNDVLPPPGGQPRFVDAIYEAWFPQRIDAEAALREFTKAPLPDGIEQSRSFALIAEQYDTQRLLGLSS